jgi:hypothetical protein
MHGTDHKESSMFSYISAEWSVPNDRPLLVIRGMTDMALKKSDAWRAHTARRVRLDCTGAAVTR